MSIKGNLSVSTIVLSSSLGVLLLILGVLLIIAPIQPGLVGSSTQSDVAYSTQRLDASPASSLSTRSSSQKQLETSAAPSILASSSSRAVQSQTSADSVYVNPRFQSSSSHGSGGRSSRGSPDAPVLVQGTPTTMAQPNSPAAANDLGTASPQILSLSPGPSTEAIVENISSQPNLKMVASQGPGLSLNFTDPPMVSIDKGSGVNERLVYLPAYIVDSFSNPENVTFQVRNSAYQVLDSCWVSSDKFLSCKTKGSIAGAEYVLLRAVDGSSTSDAQVYISVFGDDNRWWYNPLNDPKDANLSLMDVWFNDNYQGKFRRVDFGHLAPGSVDSYPGFAAVYSSSYFRLIPASAQQMNFGTSFILGPSYWDESSYFNNPNVSSLRIYGRLDGGNLTMNISASSKHLVHDSVVQLIEPAISSFVTAEVSQRITAKDSFSINPAMRNQGFKVAQFSSMNIDGDYQDSDFMRFKDSAGSLFNINLTQIAPGDILSQPVRLGAPNQIELAYGKPKTWQAAPTPSMVVDLTPNSGDLLVQGHKDFASLPNEDNIGVWVAEDMTGMSTGDSKFIKYKMHASDKPNSFTDRVFYFRTPSPNEYPFFFLSVNKGSGVNENIVRLPSLVFDSFNNQDNLSYFISEPNFVYLDSCWVTTANNLTCKTKSGYSGYDWVTVNVTDGTHSSQARFWIQVTNKENVWWYNPLNAPDDTQLSQMDVYFNNNYQGKFRRVDFGHMSKGATVGWPGAGAIYSSGYVRLIPVDEPPMKFGTSFVLGPGYWDEQGYSHNPTIDKMFITGDLTQGDLAVRLEGQSRKLIHNYYLSLKAPADAQRFYADVTQDIITKQGFAIDPAKRLAGEGFKVVQFSSMAIDGARNDANRLMFINATKVQEDIDLTAASNGQLLPLAFPIFGGTEVALAQTEKTGWQGGPTPTTSVWISNPGDGLYIQGMKNATSNPNDDNVGVWVSDYSIASLAAGQSLQSKYQLIASNQSSPPTPIPCQYTEKAAIAPIGEYFSCKLKIDDPLPGNVTYFLYGPEGMSINSITGAMTWTPTSWQGGWWSAWIRMDNGEDRRFKNLKFYVPPWPGKEDSFLNDKWSAKGAITFYESFDNESSLVKNKCINCPSAGFVPGVSGNALQIQPGVNLTFPGPVLNWYEGTISFWVKPGDWANKTQDIGLIGWEKKGDPDSFAVMSRPTNASIGLSVVDSEGVQRPGDGLFGATPLTPGVWRKVDVVFRLNSGSDLVEVYVDGAWKTTAQFADVIPFYPRGTQFSVGNVNGLDEAEMEIDELTIYPHPRYWWEISAEYNQTPVVLEIAEGAIPLPANGSTNSSGGGGGGFTNVSVAKPVSSGPVILNSTGLFVRGQPFFIKGVGYQPTPIGQDYGYDFFSNTAILDRDFPLIRQMHANTLKPWATVTNRTFLDKAWNNGTQSLMVVMPFYIHAGDIAQGAPNYANMIWRNQTRNQFRDYVTRFKDHPSVLMWSIGNENNIHYTGDIQDWYSLVEELGEIAFDVEGPTFHPVTVINGDWTYIGNTSVFADDRSLVMIDAWGSNVYRNIWDLGNFISEITYKTAKPIWFSELGTDAYFVYDLANPNNGTENQQAQVDWLRWLWYWIDQRDGCWGPYDPACKPYQSGFDHLIGVSVMEYSDEWNKGSGSLSEHGTGGYALANAHPDNFSNEEWYGLVGVQLSKCAILKNQTTDPYCPDSVIPRRAYYGMRDAFRGYSNPPTIPNLSRTVFSDSPYIQGLRFNDPDGDEVTVLLSWQDESSNYTGAIVRRLFYPEDVGENRFSVFASDGFNESRANFTLTVIPPTGPQVNITTPPRTKGSVSRQYIYDVNATDPQHGALTYSLFNAPKGMSIDEYTGVITWIPEKLSYELVEVLVTSNRSASKVQKFYVDVLDIPNRQPNLDWQVGPIGGNAPLVVNFSSNVTDDISVQSVFWYLGDGTVINVPPIVRFNHTYPLQGVYFARLVAVDNEGLSSEINFSIYVNQPAQNQPPSLSATVAPISGFAPLKVNFSWFATDNRAVQNVIWYFGDGQSLNSSATGEIVHTYFMNGSYGVQAIAFDDQGLASSKNFTINVFYPPEDMRPVIEDAWCSPLTGFVPLEVTCQVNASDDRNVSLIVWDFAGGRNYSLSPTPMGNRVIYRVNHTYNDPWSFRVYLRVYDDQALMSFQSFEVRGLTQSNQPPVIYGQATPLNGTAPLTVTFTANATDDKRVSRMTWIFADGSHMDTLPSATVTHTYTNQGIYQPIVIATDDSNLSTTLSFPRIAVFQHGPYPTASFIATPLNGTAPLTVTFNSSWFDDVGVSYLRWQFGDGDGWAGSPQQIITHTYSSPGNFTAMVTAVDDSGLTSAPATQSIFVLPSGGHAPVINQVFDSTTSTGKLSDFTFTAFDLDNDQLSFSINDSRWTQDPQTTGRFTWLPEEGDGGVYWFRVTVSDGFSQSSMDWKLTVQDCASNMMNCRDYCDGPTLMAQGSCNIDTCEYAMQEDFSPVCKKSFTANLMPGVNIITIPVEDPNFKMASQLASQADSSFITYIDDGVNFRAFVPGLTDDFELKRGKGYLVTAKSPRLMSMSGFQPKQVNYTIAKGLNMIATPLYWADFKTLDYVARKFHADWVVKAHPDYSQSRNVFRMWHPGSQTGYNLSISPFDAFILYTKEEDARSFSNRDLLEPLNYSAPQGPVNPQEFEPLERNGIKVE